MEDYERDLFDGLGDFEISESVQEEMRWFDWNVESWMAHWMAELMGTVQA